MADMHVAKRSHRTLRRASPEFADRCDAGERLGRFLKPSGQTRTVVLAIPRGGVPVGLCVAERIESDLDQALAKKLPVPGKTEQGFGAVAIDGSLALNGPAVTRLGISPLHVDSIAEQVRIELHRGAEAYGASEAPPSVQGLDVFLVDDGLATGFTMMAAAKMVRRQEPRSLVMCVPVAPADSLQVASSWFDEIYCFLVQEKGPFSVASACLDFHDVSDDEVRQALQRRRARVLSRRGEPL